MVIRLKIFPAANKTGYLINVAHLQLKKNSWKLNPNLITPGHKDNPVFHSQSCIRQSDNVGNSSERSHHKEHLPRGKIFLTSMKITLKLKNSDNNSWWNNYTNDISETQALSVTYYAYN